ncbi:serine/threonine-protein kinase [Roseimaritima ulvae]|uniref:Serine/threonine-protein kinase PknB n=1 Tax=Roseimaritima ulvae TaxID=980254 RepID=A0A5B9R941_9BACT|nr:serine/threonine-protein kinase [Roseimaritima ulvae]QEG43461.1 Serine/threonine-protein kinase PknB [Roseimaritima ulvae]
MTDDSTPDPADAKPVNPAPAEPDNADAAAAARCPQCGAAMPADAPAGLCPRCLLQLGFESQHDSTSETDPYRPPFVAPLPEHLAPHFPQLEIIERIGHGGMGVVYRAKQLNLDRLVALKILRPDVDTDPNFAERFEREAKLLGRLNHPHIVGIHDYGKTGSLFYLIMEFVDGQNLRQLEHAGQLSAAEALAIVPQICEALQYAHGQGVVHRDIKPENILINTSGQVKIADFGIAKLTELGDEWGLTGQWQVMGTPHYMAPEQIEHPSEVDHRADIYSLGVVLYEMLTGELPLGRFGVPSSRAKLDVRLDEVVLRSLEKEPQRRYQRVTEVQTDLERVRDTPTDDDAGKAASRRSLGDRFASVKQQWLGGAPHATTWPAKGLVTVGGMEIALAALLLLLAPLQGPDIESFLAIAFSSLCFGLIAALSGLLLQKREYPLLTLIGLGLNLVPGSLGWLVRGPLALWGLWTIRDRATRATFGSPAWRQSQSYQTLCGVAEVSTDTAKSTATTARQVTTRGAVLASEVAKLRSVRAGIGGILLATIWTLCCIMIAASLQIGWSQIFLPQRWELTDRTAQRIDNRLGLPHFSITGSGTNWLPSLPERQPLVLKRIQFATYPDRNRLNRLQIDLDHDVPQCSDPTTSTRGPFTQERLDNWLAAVQPFEASSDAEEDPADVQTRQRSRDNLYALVQHLHQQAHSVEPARIPMARWFDSPAIGSSSIASLLDRSVLKPTESDKLTARWTDSEGTLLSGAFSIVIWMFGLALILVRSVQPLPSEHDAGARRLSIAQMLLYLCAVASVLLALTGLLGSASYQRGYLDMCLWLGRTQAHKIRVVLMWALLGAAILSAFAAWGLRRPRLVQILRAALLPLFTITAIGLTAMLALQAPWWHDWPLLLPLWMGVLAAVAAWMSTQRREVKVPPSTASQEEAPLSAESR